MNHPPNDHHAPCQGFDTFKGIEKECSAEGLFARAYQFDKSNQMDVALEFYQRALDADPQMAAAHYNMGVIYSGLRALKKTYYHLRKAIELDPNMADGYAMLGMMHFGENQFDQALIFLEQAIAINPHFTEAHFNMGLVLHEMGEYQQSLNCFRNASICNPEFSQARWLHLLLLPMIYDTREQIDLTRRRFIRNLDELVDSIRLDTPQQVQYALRGIQTATNFYLQYQGGNDLELQIIYGGLVHQVMRAGYPQFDGSCSPNPPKSGEKIRVGYASSFMCRHTVGSFLAGWMENHDSSRFEIHGYHLGRKKDALTSHLQKYCHRFHQIPGDIEAAATQISSDQLHILVYFEIGMSIETLQLAALRLAPIQCASWGHPITTGLPTIDYFLSSDLMEPEDADQYYSENLVRFSNLSLCYTPPQLPESPLSRSDLGIPMDRFIFLSPQSIFKYLPQHDDIYPMIAKQAPHACFVFISHQSQQTTHRFHARLRIAFERHHLDAESFCHFTPRLDTNEFLSLNMAADALIDTLEWSGGKTTLEAISCGLPVISCPGRFMRGRHAYAMLKMMGVSETIAKDPMDFCRIAVRMASEPDFYHRVKASFIDQRHRIYHDKVFISELEKFYGSQANALTDCRYDHGADMAQAYFNKGIDFHSKKDWPQAITQFKKALDLKPDFVDAAFNLATALKESGHFDKAILIYCLTTELAPDLAEAHFRMGLCQQITGNSKSAITDISRALDLEPQNTRYWFHSAEIHLSLNEIDAAVEGYQKAIKRRPDWEAAHYNMAVALRMAERLEDAIHHAKQAIHINADYARAYPLLYRLAQHACDWHLAESVSNRLDEITGHELEKGLKTTEPPLTNIRRVSQVRTNMNVARSWSRHHCRTVRGQSPLPASESKITASDRIRVGYLSSDFKDHAVAYQILGMLKNHDRNKFEVYGYATNPHDGSPYRDKLANACDHFKDLHRWSNNEIARQINADGIHILVDMSGHSRDNRMGIAAHRPAPVQVSYLGFLSTTGAEFFDYTMADPIVLPRQHAAHYTEKIAYLPHCYQANDDSLQISEQTQIKSQWSLPDKAFVYCSFNQSYKIDRRLFDTWMNILKAVDNAVLWLVERSPLAQKNLKTAARNAGVDPDRLIFTGFVPMELNLARLQLADLMLDTLIYNGGATTANALWAGVPVLSMLGDHWVSRMSASALEAIGLPELIAMDLEDYEHKAVSLALDRNQLKTLRNKLWHRRSISPLFDTALFTRHIEEAYRQMWQRKKDGLAPASFKIEP